jgi:hypothetical protein
MTERQRKMAEYEAARARERELPYDKRRMRARPPLGCMILIGLMFLLSLFGFGWVGYLILSG